RPSRRLLISYAPRALEGDWITGLSRHFQPYPLEVRRAYTGRETIGLVERSEIDAAILSVELPQMDGLNVLRIIRSIDAELPCVMLTADASKRTLQRALELGAYSVVTQPVDPVALWRVMAGLFRRCFEWELE
ncbi:MAG: response regulator transcription factor, partial [Planctomycetota bacterium]